MGTGVERPRVGRLRRSCDCIFCLETADLAEAVDECLFERLFLSARKS